MTAVSRSELTDFTLRQNVAPVAPRFMMIAGVVGMLAWFISLYQGNPHLARLAVIHGIGGFSMILLGLACHRAAAAGREVLTTIISILFILVTATFICIVAANNHTGLLQSLPYCMVMIVIAGFFWPNAWGVVIGSIVGMTPPAILVITGHSILTMNSRLVSIYIQLSVTALAASFFMYLFTSRVRRSYLIALREVEELSRRDTLTGLFNRRHFHEAVTARRAETAQLAAGRDALLLYVDADHFKTINDRLGHAEGDLVLQQMARVLEAVCEPVDVIARYGGEEFVIFRPELAPGAEVHLADRIRAALRERGRYGDHHPESTITVSIGGTIVIPGEPLEAALQRADTALLQAKRKGRDRMIVVLNTARADSAAMRTSREVIADHVVQEMRAAPN